MNQDKNTAKWTNFFESHYDMLFHYGIKLSKNEHLTEEAIQELFVYLFEKKIDIDAIQHPKAYLLTSFRRLLLKIGKNKGIFTPLEEDIQFPDFEFSPEDFMIHQEQQHETLFALNQAMNNLPTRQKEVLYLKYFDGLKTEEISKIMNINQQAVFNTLYKAIKSLRDEPFLRNLFIFIYFFQP